jgi:hypothetical protein
MLALLLTGAALAGDTATAQFIDKLDLSVVAAADSPVAFASVPYRKGTWKMFCMGVATEFSCQLRRSRSAESLGVATPIWRKDGYIYLEVGSRGARGLPQYVRFPESETILDVLEMDRIPKQI